MSSLDKNPHHHDNQDRLSWDLSDLGNTSAYGNRHLFTGREWLREVSLADHRNRYYSPYLGRWTSTDPIQFEAGGVNLYRYVGNGIANRIDLTGLFDGDSDPNHPSYGPGGAYADKSGTSALGIFKDQYQKMRQANWRNSDKYFHCMANCEAARKGHSEAANRLSNLREWVDRTVKGDSRKDCEADQEANRHGREAGREGQNCKQACDKYRPVDLPDKY